MPAYLYSALTFFLGFVLVMLASQSMVDRSAQLQRDIARRGLAVYGRVLRVRQPPLAGSFARIYFEFEPEGSGKIVRCCHIDRRALSAKTSLPAPGASVIVRYLPDNPTQAVIAKLVSRFAY